MAPSKDQIILYDDGDFTILNMRFFEADPEYPYGLHYKGVWVESYVNYWVAERDAWDAKMPWLAQQMDEIDNLHPKK